MKSTHMRFPGVVPLLTAVVLLLGGGSAAVAGNGGTLVFQGDSTFHGPHGGQAIQAAVVETDTGKVVAKQSGTVSKTADPSFSFTFPGVLEKGKSFEVQYWIDSNFGGGTVGHCDSKEHDHQWNVKLGVADGNNVTYTDRHRPSQTTSVCKTFSGM